MSYNADTIEHVDQHIGCVSLPGRPETITLTGRPSPVDRPIGGIAPRYRFSDDLDGKHRDHDIHFQSIMTTEDGLYAIVQESDAHMELD